MKQEPLKTHTYDEDYIVVEIKGYVKEIDDVKSIPISYDRKKERVNIVFGEWRYEIPIEEFREKLKLLGIKG
jgi:hypothetical protein